MATTLFPLQYLRQNASPIDVDSVFDTTADRIAYLANGRRYPGQIVADLEDQKIYVLNTAANAWLSIDGVPGGSTGQVQYNLSGNFAANSGFTYDGATCTVGLSKIGNIGAVDVLVGNPQAWIAQYGDLGVEAGDEYTGMVAYGSGGSIYVSGGGADLGEPFLAKIGTTGALDWQKTFTNTAGNYKTGDAVKVDPAGNIYYTAANAGGGSNSVYVAKLDPTAAIIWQRNLDNPAGPMYGADIDYDSSGNVYVLLTDHGNNTSVLVKYNSTGTLQWQRSFAGINYVNPSLYVDAAGNSYYTSNSVTGMSNQAALVKYDTTGVLQWQKTVSHPGTQVGIGDITVDSTGAVLFTVSGSPASPPGSVGVVKCDSSGNPVWQVNLLDTGPYEWANTGSIAVDNLGDIYHTYVNTVAPSYRTELAVTKYTSAGVRQWSRSLSGADDIGSGWWWTNDNLDVQGGNYIIAGYTYNPGLGNSNVVVGQLPGDGSGTGTWGNYTYADLPVTEDTTLYTVTASTIAEDAGMLVDSAGDLATTDADYTLQVTNVAYGWTFNTDGSTDFPGYTLPADDGAAGQALVTDGSGNISWADAGSGPGGAITQVQYNNGSSFGANSGFTYDSATCTVGLSKIISTVDVNLKVDTGNPFMWYAVTGNISATNETGSAVAYDTAGNIYVAAGDQEPAALLIKYNNQGEIVWQKSLYDSTSIESLAGDGVVVDGSGNIVILCQTYNSKFVVAKFDPAGTILWQIMVDNPSLGGEIATDIAVDGTGNIYVSVQDFNNIYVVKLSPLGVYISNTALTGTGYEAYSIAVDTSNNVYLTISTSASTVIIVKIDLTGSITWQREYSFAGGSVSSALGAIAVDSTGYIYASGGSYTTDESMYLFKLDPAGNLVWQRNVIVGSFGIEASGLAFDSTGNIYVAGTWSSGSNGKDFLIFKYSQTGTLLWQRSFGSVNDDDQWWNYGSQILSVNGDTYALNGYSWFSSGNRNILTAQLNTDGSGTGTYGNFTYEATSFIEDAAVFSSTAGGVVPGSTVFNATPTTFTVDNSTYTNNVFDIVAPRNWYFNTDGSTQLPGYTLPAADGTAGQVLMTDGTGSTTWSTVSVNPATPTAAGIVYARTSSVNCNISLGYCSSQNSMGFSNVAIGYGTLQINQGSENIGLGRLSLCKNTYGASNIGIGTNTLMCNTLGSANIAIGCGSIGFGNNIGYQNIGIGVSALSNNTDGCTNIAVGSSSLFCNTSGSTNVAIGPQTLLCNTIGCDNIAIGVRAMRHNVSGFGNIAIGKNSMSHEFPTYGQSAGYFNVAVGQTTLSLITTGSYNTAVGQGALMCNTHGYSNVAVGAFSLLNNTTGFGNIGIGGGGSGSSSGMTGCYNIALANSTLAQNTCGSHNIALGQLALRCNTSGNHNIAQGYRTLQTGTTGCNNIAIGCCAIGGYGCNRGSNNIGIGGSVLAVNTTGFENISIGRFSLASNLTGFQNIAIGSSANSQLCAGFYNIAVGNLSLYCATNACCVIAIGSSSAGFGVPHNGTVAIGHNSQFCYSLNKFYGHCGNDVSIGTCSLWYGGQQRCGGANVAIGFRALACSPYLGGFCRGGKNVAIGYEAMCTMYGAGVISTEENIALGFHAFKAGSYSGGLAPVDSVYGNIAIGAGALCCGIRRGASNIAIGYQAMTCMASCYSVSSNIAIGTCAMAGTSTGAYSIAIGGLSMCTGARGLCNTSIGYASSVCLGGCENSTFGAYSTGGTTTSCRNTSIGAYSCTLGSNNTALGVYAQTGCCNTGNISIGICAGRCLATGCNNTVIGQLDGTAGLQSTLLLGAGTTERLRVDSTGLYINGTGTGSAITFRNVYQTITSLTGATGVVTHDFSLGSLFNHTSISGNFTVNVTNLNLNPGYVANVTLILNQGATAYMANAFQIAGAVQTINWVYGIPPGGTVNGKDIVNFSITNIGGTYTVFGQSVTYS